MSVKWKIFLVLNFILAIPSLTMDVLLFLNLGNTRSDESIYVILFGLCLLVLVVNAFFNIILVQKYYPDKMIPALFRNSHGVLTIFTAVLTILLLVLCLHAANDVYNTDYPYSNREAKRSLTLLFVFTFIQLISLVMQFQLPRHIKHNNEKKMDSLIDSIGK